MLLMLALFSISLIVPQWPDFSERDYNASLAKSAALRLAHDWGLTDIYGSMAMAVAFAILFSNLAVGFGERLQILKTEIDIRRAKMSGRSAETARVVPLRQDAATLHRLSSLLAARRFAVAILPGNAGLAAVRNRYSVIGSHFFHLSAVFFVAALGLRLATHFHGVTVLGEGETFKGVPAQYISTRPRRPPASHYPVNIDFSLQKISAAYDANGRLLNATALIQPFSQVFTAPVYSNHPFRNGDTTIRLTDYGAAPILVVREPEKKIEHRAAVRLALYPAGREDSFQFPELPIRFRIAFYPGIDNEGGPASRTVQPARRPTAKVQFERDGSTYSALLPQNGITRVGGLEIGLFSVKYWARFEVDRDSGRIPMYLALVIGFFGLAWRLLFQRSRVDAVWTADGMRISGRADYTNEPFRSEFEQIVTEFTNSEAR